jgi:DsbC/DsbD-like thiol-disulfide interchange protein
MLTSRVVAPHDLKPDAQLHFSAEASWLCCKEACLTGSAKLQMMLDSSADSRPANQTVFKDWAAQVPTTRPADVRDRRVELAPRGKITLVIDWQRPPKDLEVFPGPNEALTVSDVSVQTTGSTSTIKLTLKRTGEIDAKSLPYQIVVGYTDADGNRRGLLNEITSETLKALELKR